MPARSRTVRFAAAPLTLSDQLRIAVSAAAPVLLGLVGALLIDRVV